MTINYVYNYQYGVLGVLAMSFSSIYMLERRHIDHVDLRHSAQQQGPVVFTALLDS